MNRDDLERYHIGPSYVLTSESPTDLCSVFAFWNGCPTQRTFGA